MKLIIARTSKCVHLLWRDTWSFLEYYYWGILALTFAFGICTCGICAAGISSPDGFASLKPWVSKTFSIASFMVLSSLAISFMIWSSYPLRWIRDSWRKACQFIPKPDVWDREDN